MAKHLSILIGLESNLNRELLKCITQCLRQTKEISMQINNFPKCTQSFDAIAQ